MKDVDVAIVTTLAELVSLRDEWDALSAAFCTPLLDHDWCVTAAESLHEDDEIRTVVIRQAGRVTAIAPMVADHRLGGRLAVPGASTLYEPGGWLYASPDALAELARAVVRIGSPVVLHRCPAHSSLCTQLPDMVLGRGIAVDRPAAATWALDTRRARPSNRALRALKPMWFRARRAHGDVSFALEEVPAGAVNTWLQAFEQVEGSGWKRRAGSCLSSRPDLQRFFRAYLAKAAMRGRTVVSTLRFDGAIAAMELTVHAYGRLWQLKTGYDERFSAYYPGLLLTDAVIDRVLASQLDGYEFLGSAERWQKRWSNVRREHRMTALYPFSAAGLCALLADGFRHIRHRLNWGDALRVDQPAYPARA